MELFRQCYGRERRKIVEGHSKSLLENYLTTPWLKMKMTNNQAIVHSTQHRKLRLSKTNLTKYWKISHVFWKSKQILLDMRHPFNCLCQYTPVNNSNSEGDIRKRLRHTTLETYPLSSVKRLFCISQPLRNGVRKMYGIIIII